MTPNARYAASIEILDRILTGEPAEKTLTNWARSNRYAGSKDRAAVRDIVFDCLRRKRSLMYLAGFDGARGLVAGHILAAGQAVGNVFTGERFASEVLSRTEQSSLDQLKETPSDAVRLDVPDWIVPKLRESLGDAFEANLCALQTRAPLDLRVNQKKANVSEVQQSLAKDDIETTLVAIAPNALRVTRNPRRVALSASYRDGLVEIQDAGAQAIVAELPLDGVKAVLDYCAGGGGKTLAMAARIDGDARFDAYDQNKVRMNDSPVRAQRAGVSVRTLQVDPVLTDITYDLVMLDVPCSGTGAWRRNPDGKWRFTDAELNDLLEVQARILEAGQKSVASGGLLAYVTCSLLTDENETQVATFLANHKEWRTIQSKRFHCGAETDGFFLALFEKDHL